MAIAAWRRGDDHVAERGRCEGRLSHPPEADRDQLGHSAFVGLAQKLDRITPVLGRLPAAMRGARRGVAQRLPCGAPSSADVYPPGEPAASFIGSCFAFVLSILALLIRHDALSGANSGDCVRRSGRSAHVRSRNQIDSSVDINRAAGDPLRQRSRQIGAGEADVHDVDKLPYRRPLLGLVQQQLEILQPRSRARL